MRSGRPQGFQRPLYLRSHPPAGVTLFLAVVHGGAVTGIFAASLPVVVKLGLLLPVVAGFVIASRRAYSHAGMRLVLNARGDWFVIKPSGKTAVVSPRSALFIHPRLLILTVCDEQKHWYPFIFSAWNTDSDTLRRLRVRLRHSRP